MLEEGGRLAFYVPRDPGLFSPLEEVLGHRCRYTRSGLREELTAAEFTIERLEFFNRVSVPAWWWNGKVMRRKLLGRWQLKLFDLLVPLLRRIDRFLPWKGLGLVAVARKGAA